MVKIIFVDDLAQKEQQALDFIETLYYRSNLPKTDPEYFNVAVAKLITSGLRKLRDSDVDFPLPRQDDYEAQLIYTDETGTEREVTKTIAKPLSPSRIYEFLINWDDHYFRATFFPFRRGGEQYYCFTYAFLKTLNPNYNPTKHYIALSERIYDRVLKNPKELDNY